MESSNRQFAALVAAALGAEWSVKPATHDWEERHPRVQRADGPSFWIGGGPDTREKQYNIHSEWPKDQQGAEHRPSSWANNETVPTINFTASKSPDAAAKDITRRFLPAYLPLWEKYQAEAAGADSYHTNRRTLAQHAAAIVGGKVIEEGKNPAIVRIPYGDGPRITEVGLGSNNVITIEVSGNLELLRAIQNLLVTAAQPASTT